MIVVRDRFQLKFGKAKEAKETLKDIKKIMNDMKMKPGKAMTDITGRSYTLVLEMEFESLSEYEKISGTAFGNKDWQDWYKKFVPLVESSDREIFTIVD
ncbi:MAG: NIPSNAP family protein [Ignavibacteria bacterium]